MFTKIFKIVFILICFSYKDSKGVEILRISSFHQVGGGTVVELECDIDVADLRDDSLVISWKREITEANKIDTMETLASVSYKKSGPDTMLGVVR